MKPWALMWLALILVLGACGSRLLLERDRAIFTCRQAGYLGAVEDAGTWYCFRDRLGVPPVVPAKTP
jgi:hypothetical protein